MNKKPMCNINSVCSHEKLKKGTNQPNQAYSIGSKNSFIFDSTLKWKEKEEKNQMRINQTHEFFAW